MWSGGGGRLLPGFGLGLEWGLGMSSTATSTSTSTSTSIPTCAVISNNRRTIHIPKGYCSNTRKSLLLLHRHHHHHPFQFPFRATSSPRPSTPTPPPPLPITCFSWSSSSSSSSSASTSSSSTASEEDGDSHPSNNNFHTTFVFANEEQEQEHAPKKHTSASASASAAVVSGTTARGRRLLKVREEKRKREHDRLHNYPSWAKVLQDACKHDEELRAVLGDSIGNPELMRQRVEDRVRRKGRNFHKSKTGSVLGFKVSFRDFNLVDSYIWFELYGSPSDRDVDLLGSVIQSWYVMGRLGAFNSSNLQLANSSMEYNPLYDADKGFKVMPSSFHDISDIEFQDNWGRVWVDLGTCDFFAIDVLLNCLTVLSSEYLGIQQVVFGGRRMGDWEEGMRNPDYGYKHFKI